MIHMNKNHVKGGIQAVWKTGILVWAPKLTLVLKSTFQVLIFQLYFNKKYVEESDP